MKVQQYWPFLIAAGIYEDYDFVLAPEFIAKDSSLRDIWRETQFQATQASDKLRTFSVDHGAAGPIVFSYQTQRVVIDGKEVRDSSGRVNYQSFGIITKGSSNLSKAQFDRLVA